MCVQVASSCSAPEFVTPGIQHARRGKAIFRPGFTPPLTPFTERFADPFADPLRRQVGRARLHSINEGELTVDACKVDCIEYSESRGKSTLERRKEKRHGVGKTRHAHVFSAVEGFYFPVYSRKTKLRVKMAMPLVLRI